MLRKRCIFAAKTAKRKEIYMATAMTVPVYDSFTIDVPRIESKRFKAIVKAFGFDFRIHTRTPLQQAIEEENSGKIYSYASLDDLIKEIG